MSRGSQRIAGKVRRVGKGTRPGIVAPARTDPTATAPGLVRRVHAGIWAAGLGCMLSLALLKLGNPVVLGDKVEPPEGLQEWLFFAWPPQYGFVPLALVVVGAGSLWKGARHAPLWWLLLGVGWLGWQALATSMHWDLQESRPVLAHYGTLLACAGCGCLLAQLSPRHARWFWLLLTAGFVWVLFEGFRQHYGGLEATRQYVYEQPGWQGFDSDFLKRLARDRVFSTLFYANALAGVVILLLPALAWLCWCAWPKGLRLFRSVTTGLLAYAGLACLLWSGSKAGWLIAMCVAAVAVLHLPAIASWGDSSSQQLRKESLETKPPLLAWNRWRLAVILLGVTAGLGAFGIRFQDYFQRGATSAFARFDYWSVAAAIVVEKPIVGGGPGSFESLYRERKKPDAEMTRLVHNDYLQQASDSGIPGGLLFGAWIWGGLASAYRSRRKSCLDWMVGLGLFGWALQEVVEFGLFIPAVSWPAVVLLGWLVARTQPEVGKLQEDGSCGADLRSR